MLKNLSEKNKFYVLAGSFLVLLIVCYQVAMKGTLNELKNNRELKNKASEAEEIPQQTALLKKQLADLNNLYFRSDNRGDDNHEIILERVSDLAGRSDCSVAEFPAKHLFRTMNIQVETHSIVLTGRFPGLLKVLYELEVNEKTGRLVSVGYYTETDRRTRQRNLFSRIYIQNYRNLMNHEDK
ncbi:MAG: hypothetical protein PVF73_08315 [Bacteroidales bacterium]|jgi:hypothetical protein